MRIAGFIGLGIMGKPMARNLIKAGYDVCAVGGHAQQVIEELKPEGLKVLDTPASVAQAADAVITCLPDSPDVEEVCLGEHGLLAGASAGLVIADMSTISPMVAKRIAGEAAQKGVAFLDAPVSGGQKGAIEGTLSIMVGGDAEPVKRFMPLFEAMGKTIVHVGPSGAGQFTKCANQIICSVTWQAIAEGMALGAKAGVDPAKMLEAISAGAARCWALEVRTPEVLRGNFEPGFMAKLQYKDLGIALEAGKAFEVPQPVTAMVTEFYKAIVAAGRGDWDTSALVTLTEDLAGVEIRSGQES